MSANNYKNDDEPTDDYAVKASVKHRVYVRRQNEKENELQRISKANTSPSKWKLLQKGCFYLSKFKVNKRTKMIMSQMAQLQSECKNAVSFIRRSLGKDTSGCYARVHLSSKPLNDKQKKKKTTIQKSKLSLIAQLLYKYKGRNVWTIGLRAGVLLFLATKCF